METKPWDYYHQKIINAHEVPPRSQQIDFVPPIPVRARIVWEKDGEEHVETIAHAHAGRLVLVELTDRRNLINAAWLHAEDTTKTRP